VGSEKAWEERTMMPLLESWGPSIITLAFPRGMRHTGGSSLTLR